MLPEGGDFGRYFFKEPFVIIPIRRLVHSTGRFISGIRVHQIGKDQTKDSYYIIDSSGGTIQLPGGKRDEGNVSSAKGNFDTIFSTDFLEFSSYFSKFSTFFLEKFQKVNFFQIFDRFLEIFDRFFGNFRSIFWDFRLIVRNFQPFFLESFNLFF